jgi:transcriptional regulator with XRE-family HTH domain
LDQTTDNAVSELEKAKLEGIGARFSMMYTKLGYKTANDFAIKLGELLNKDKKPYDKGTLSKIENGKMMIPNKVIVVLNSTFGISTDWLINAKGEMIDKDRQSIPGDQVGASLKYEGMVRTGRPQDGLTYFDELAIAHISRTCYMALLERGQVDPDGSRDERVRAGILDAKKYIEMKKQLVA